jgi:hypothetical protein
MFESPDDLRPGLVSARPLDEHVDALGGDGELLSEHVDDVRGLGEEPTLYLHESHLQVESTAAAMSAVPGTVVTQAIPICLTTDQRILP